MAVVNRNLLWGTFVGRDTPGPIALVGVTAGDKVFDVRIQNSYIDEKFQFEPVITVTGQIRQISGTLLSAYTFEILVLN